MTNEITKPTKEDCLTRMLTVRDALDVISGKWKLLIIISIMDGNNRFREIERSIPKISSKVLSKELKDLEEHQLIQRIVSNKGAVSVEYLATDYIYTLEKVIGELHNWGLNHRKKIIGSKEDH
jgi:DNA-binding HxlR family transcriptional regulator